MPTTNHRDKNKRLQGRTLYIPQMSYCAARAMAAAFESIGIRAQPSPDSDARTLELGGKYVSGDECLPAKVTLGNFMKVVEGPGFDPKKTAFLLPTSDGPCRFGQYLPYLRKVLKDLGFDDVMFISPTCVDSYEGMGKYASELIRTAWRAVVVSDILRKLLLKTRPYELEKGITDRVFHQCLQQLCQSLSERNISHKRRLKNLVSALTHIRAKFRKIPTNNTRKKPLIGIVGESFCRFNDFSNNFLIEKIEAYGGEVWLYNMAGWIWYSNEDQKRELIEKGKRFSIQMLGAKLKFAIQGSDERVLYEPFSEDFQGYEEPPDIHQILDNSEPYLPFTGALGEMVVTAGSSIYLYKKGADGVIDISPFTCMQGIVCEAVYPQLSQDHDHFPIRTFFFDGNHSDLDRDVDIFMELAKSYQRRKKINRVYP